jgi:hypothetical protein
MHTELMVRNQRGFSVVEILVIIVSISLVFGGFYALKKSRDSFGENIRYSPYGNAQVCADSPGVKTELSSSLKKHHSPEYEKVLANKYMPVSAALHTKDKVYSLTIDTDASAVGSAQIHWVFKPILLDQAATKKLVNSKATLTYKENDKSITSQPFELDSGTCDLKPLI